MQSGSRRSYQHYLEKLIQGASYNYKGKDMKGFIVENYIQNAEYQRRQKMKQTLKTLKKVN